MAEQPSLDNMIQRLYEDEKNDIMGAQYKLDKIYKSLAHLIEETAKLLDISQEQLVKHAKITTYTYHNLKWYDVIGVINMFYVNKNNEGK